MSIDEKALLAACKAFAKAENGNWNSKNYAEDIMNLMRIAIEAYEAATCEHYVRADRMDRTSFEELKLVIAEQRIKALEDVIKKNRICLYCRGDGIEGDQPCNRCTGGRLAI